MAHKTPDRLRSTSANTLSLPSPAEKPSPGRMRQAADATGSASGPLGASLFRHQVVTTAQATRRLSLQGVKMGRPSSIAFSLTTSQNAIHRVRVGGAAVLVGEGTLIC